MIIVYQFGKVGSMALTGNINRQLGDDTCHWGHYLGERYHRFFKSLVTEEPYDRVTIWDKSRLSTLIAQEDELMRRYKAAAENEEEIKFITGVREPIDRSISLLFQVIHYITPIYDALDDDEGAWIETLSRFLEKIWLGSDEELASAGRTGQLLHSFVHMPERWFGEEFATFTGLDMKGIVVGQGGTIIKNGNRSAYLYRFEDGKKSIADGVAKFLGLSSLATEAKNSVTDKRSSILHDRFRARYRPSTGVIEKAYAQSWLNSFYSSDEIAGFRRAWEERGEQ